MESKAPPWFRSHDYATKRKDALRFVFYNSLLEAWTAEIKNDGSVTIAAEDLGWDTIEVSIAEVSTTLRRLRASRHIEDAQRELQVAPLDLMCWVAFHGVNVGAEERAWLLSVFMVAHERVQCILES